ncbi:hypothetical protein LCGC14_1340290, partial [marine sediment metagenome]
MNLDKKEILRRIDAANSRVEKSDGSKGVLIGTLISVVIAIVVGVSIIPGITDAAAEAEKDAPPVMAGLFSV